MKAQVLVLGIETSCDETAAAVVRNGRSVLAGTVLSQDPVHREYGGVVPELASRAHLRSIDSVVERTLSESGIPADKIDLIAVTYGPGLVGSLLVGVSYAKGLAFAKRKPLVKINHVEAHLYAPLLDGRPVGFPAVGLVVSGGHSSLYYCGEVGDWEFMGGTRDDAAGEAFDKVAAILRLGYPGGPAVDAASRRGDPSSIRFPRAMMRGGEYDFSFSGLKTAVLYHVRKQGETLDGKQIADVCASFQEAVADVLVAKTMSAAEERGVGTIIAGGGVVRNERLRERLAREGARRGLAVRFPPPELCVDNAAMVAGLAFHVYNTKGPSGLDFDVLPTL